MWEKAAAAGQRYASQDRLRSAPRQRRGGKAAKAAPSADIFPSTVSKNFHDSRVAALVKSGDLQGERKDLLICMECYEKHNKCEWLS